MKNTEVGGKIQTIFGYFSKEEIGQNKNTILPIIFGVLLLILGSIYFFVFNDNFVSDKEYISSSQVIADVPNLVTGETAFKLSENSIPDKKTGDELTKEEALTVLIDDTEAEVDATVTDTKGNKFTIPNDHLRFQAGSVVMIVKPLRSFTPGLYTLEATVSSQKNKNTKIFTQDFVWGVLAVNTDKDTYQIGEKADVHIGVLNDFGVPVCNAEVRLEITTPNQIIDQPEVQNTGECEVLEVGHIIPDYQANYTFTEAGEYLMTLTADIGSGEKTISSKINVFDEVDKPDFVVRRTSATRNYPLGPTPMTLEVKFNEDYQGNIVDVVPDSFEISNLSNEGAIGISEAKDSKTIIWNVSAVAGDTLMYNYDFNAPDISPEYYTIGPLELKNENSSPSMNLEEKSIKIKEDRFWQIANDTPPTDGPGGVMTNLGLWLKADMGTSTVIDGANLTSWSDQSGNGNNVTAPGGNEPTYESGTTDLINFNPVIEFTGANSDYLGTAATGIIGSNNAYTKIAVYIIKSTGYANNLISSGATPDTHAFLYGPGISQLRLYHITTLNIGSATAQSIATPYIGVAKYGAGITDAIVDVNGKEEVSDNTGAHAFNGNGTIQLGAYRSANFLDGKIAEAIIYDDDITLANLQKVESYLALKYGLSLSNDNNGDSTTFEAPNADGIHEGDYVLSDDTVAWDASVNQTYHNDVAGIAQDDTSALDQTQSSADDSDGEDKIIISGATGQDDGEALIWGNDGGALAATASYNGISNKRVARVWKVQETGDVGTITVSIPSAAVADLEKMVVHTDPSFATSDREVTLSVNGDNLEATIDFNNGDYFSFITSASLIITSPVQYQTYQRDGGDEADISITGTYVGCDSDNAEASFNGGAYATIDSSLAGGTFSGTLSSQSAGQGSLIVRCESDTDTQDTVADVGIGDVYVVAGQSNAEGRLTNQKSYSHASLKAAVFDEDDNWLEGNDPTDPDPAEKGSVWPLLATHIMGNQDVPVAFITTADSATGLVTPDEDWKKGGTGSGQYENMQQQVTDSGVNAVKAVLWHQGERDANNNVSQNDYNTAFDQVASDMAADLPGAPPMVAAVIGQVGTAPNYVSGIRAATIEAWDDNAGILYGPQIYDLGPLADGVHLTTDAEGQTAADRWWAALEEHFYGGSDGRGPILLNAFIDDTNTLVTMSFSDDNLPLLPTSGLGGFEVKNNGTPVAIDSIDRTATDEITITLSAAATGTVTVSLGDSNDAAGETVPTDSSTYNLPADPFIDEAMDPFIAYSGSFTESANNDGSVTGSVVATITDDTFVNGGSTLTEGVHFILTNKPAGLTAVMNVSGPGDTATLTFTGNATYHNNLDDVSDLTITWQDGAFTTTASAIDVGRYEKDDAVIDFISGTPGGVLTNIKWWLKANTGTSTVIDGANLTSWSDQSGYGNDVSAPGGNEPTYESGTTDLINFNPVIEFNGANSDYMETVTAGIIPNGNAYTKVVVFIRDNTSYSGNLISAGSTPANGNHSMNFGLGSARMNLRNGTSFDIETTNDQLDSTPYIGTGLHGNGLVDTIININGKEEANAGLDSGGFLGTTSNLQIGAYRSANFLDGKIAEAIVYDDAVSLADLQKIESYLALKYGLTLSNDNNGDSTTFEAPNADGIHEGDYVLSDDTVVWDASVNQTYHNDVAGVEEDTDSELNQVTSKSENADGIVSIGSATDQGSLESLIWGNDNGAATFSTTGAPTGREILDRVWKIQETGDVGTVTFTIDAEDADFDLPAAQTNYYLLVDADGDFSSGAIEYQLYDDASNGDAIAADNIYSKNTVAVTDGDYFSIVTEGGASIAWSGNFTEATANDGSVTGSRTATLTNDTYIAGIANGNPFTETTHYTVANVPTGLTAVLTKTSSTVATLTLTGNATNHLDANDVADLTVTFVDGVFTNNATASDVVGYTDNTGQIDFADQPSIAYTGAGFTEATANDGSVTGSIIATLTGDTYQDTDTDDILDETTELVLADVPTGLTAVITLSAGDTVATLTLTGNATNHLDADDVADITFAFQDGAFTNTTTAANVDNATGPASSSLGVDFADQPSIAYDVTTFTEDAANDGSIGNDPTTATLTGDTFVDPITLGVHVQVNNVPAGLSASVNRTGATTIEVSLTGNATSHTDADDISNLEIVWLDGAFTNTTSAANVTNYSKTDFVVDFTDHSYLLVEFNNIAYSEAEASGSISGNLSVRGGIIAASESVNVVLADNTATAGTDYVAGPISVTIPIGDYTTVQSVAFSITVTDDNLLEGNETINLSLNNFSAGAISGDADEDTTNRSTATATITEDDGLTVEFTKATNSKSETVTSPVFKLSVSGGDATGYSGTLTIKVAVTGGTATTGTDYTFSSPKTITIPNADYTTLTKVTIPLTIKNDTKVENNETIIFGLQNPSSYVVVGDASGDSTTNTNYTYTILDDDSLSADLSTSINASASSVEPGDSIIYTVSITNNGPNEAENLISTTTLPSGSTYVSASGTGWSCYESNLKVTCTRISLSASSSVDIWRQEKNINIFNKQSSSNDNISIKIKAPQTEGTITTQATISSNTTDDDITNNTTSKSVLVAYKNTDLKVEINTSADPTTNNITYGISISNNGPDEAENVVASIILPPNSTFISASGTGWSCEELNGEVTCETSIIDSGAEANEITIIVNANSLANDFIITVSVSSDGEDSNLANNTKSASVSMTNLKRSHNIVVGAGQGDGPQVSVFDNQDGDPLTTFFAYDSNYRFGVNVAAGDLNMDGKTEIVTGPGGGGGPQVRIFDQNGVLLSQFMAYSSNARFGIKVAVGDTNGNGQKEIITIPAKAAPAHVKIWDQTGKLLSSFFAYPDTGRAAGYITTGDTSNNGREEIIVGSGGGGYFPATVKIFNHQAELVSEWKAYDSTNYFTGVTVAAGDLTGDGTVEVVTGVSSGNGPNVKVFNPLNAKLLSSFFAYDSNYSCGVNVAVGDMNNDGNAEIVTAPDQGGGPHVKTFDAETNVLMSFFVYNKNLREGLNITTSEF
ncbi:MAG: sialate O-acetylesterase [bacterium]